MEVDWRLTKRFNIAKEVGKTATTTRWDIFKLLLFVGFIEYEFFMNIDIYLKRFIKGPVVFYEGALFNTFNRDGGTR